MSHVSSNYENTGKNVTADLTTNYDAETNTSHAEKIKNVHEHNLEGCANNGNGYCSGSLRHGSG